MSINRIDLMNNKDDDKTALMQQWETQIKQSANQRKQATTVTATRDGKQQSSTGKDSGDLSRPQYDAFVPGQKEDDTPGIYQPTRGDDTQQAPKETHEEMVQENPKSVPGVSGKVISEVEKHCFCNGKHNPETGTDCYMVITSMHQEDGTPVHSPEIGKRQAYKD